MRLSTEQTEFCDLVRRFFSERVSSEYLRGRISSGQRSDTGLRQSLQDLGLYETFSGAEPTCGLVELALLAEECGRALVPDSCVEHVLINALLESLVSPGEWAAVSGLFRSAQGGGCALAFPGCCDFSVEHDSGSVSGTATWAICGEGAALLLGFTSTGTGARAFLANLSTLGTEASTQGGVASISNPAHSLDLTTPLTQHVLTKAPCVVLGSESTENLSIAIEVLKASEVSGLCQRVLEMTLEYVKTRNQFGVPIGSFQAIQHKLAQVYADSEALASLCRFAAWSFTASPEQRRITSRAAALRAAELGVHICEVAIQCHGGIGFTWEYDLHLFLRRAQVIHAAFGITESRANELIQAASC